MMIFKKLLTLMLALELMLSPLMGGVIISKAQAQSCPAGQAFDNKLGRCVLKDSVVKTQTQVDHCKSLTTAEAQKSCYENNAQSQANSNGDAKGANSKLINHESYYNSAAAISLPLFFLIYNLSNKKSRGGVKCRPSSLMLLYGGAGALIVGEGVSYIQHKSHLDKMDKDFGDYTKLNEGANSDDVNKEASIDQVQAFEFLARNQDSLKKVATTKTVAYGIASGLFATGTVMAFIEKGQLTTARTKGDTTTIERLTCKPATAEEKAKAQKNMDESNKEAADKAEAEKLEAEKAKAENVDGSNAGSQDGKYTKKETKIEETTTHTDGSVTVKKTETTETYSNGGQNTQGQSQDGASAGSQGGNTLKDLLPAATSMGSGLIKGSGGNNNQDSSGNQTSSQTNEPATTIGTPCPTGNECKGPFTCAGPTAEQRTCQCPQDTQFDPINNTCKPDSASSGFSIEQLKNLKVAKQALSNMNTAPNYEVAFEILEEINSLEFDNYSRTHYLPEEVKSMLRELPFEKMVLSHISSVIVPEAYAQLDPDDPLNNDNPKNADSQNNNENANQSPYKNAMDAVTAKNGPKVVEKALKAASGLVDKAIYEPLGRATINGMLTTWMGYMTVHMAGEIKKAKERATLLRTMKNEFEVTGGIATCGSSDRNNPSMPICYCFNSDNSLNAARANSQICANKLVSLSQTSTESSIPNVSACLTQGMELDTSCKCRANNSCMKVSQLSGTGLSTGTFRMMNSMSAPANDLFSGNAAAGSMDPASIGNNAAKVKKIADQLIAKEPQVAKGSQNLEKALLSSTKGLKPAPGLGEGTSSNFSNFNPAQAAAELKKEIEEKSEEIRTAGSQNGGGGSTDAPVEDLEFGLTQDMLNQQESEIANVMKQDLDMKENDINTNSTNIFETLSHRYQKSGMRRLFDEKNKGAVEAPASSDISE